MDSHDGPGAERWLGRLGLTSRVARRLLGWTLGIGLVGSVAVSGWQLWRDAELRERHIAADLASLGEFAAPALAHSVWTVDREAQHRQLEAFLRVSYVSAVRLEADRQPPLEHGSSAVAARQVQRTVELMHRDGGELRHVGRLVLIKHLQGEDALGWQRAFTTLAGNAMVILLSALACVVLYQALVTRRLVDIARQLRGVTAADLKAQPISGVVPAAAPPRDELDDLSEGIASLKRTGAVALREIEAGQARLRGLMDTIPDLIWLKDLNGRYLACNPAFESFFGAREADLIGKDDCAFFDRELAEFFRENDRLALQADAPRTNEEWLTFAVGGRHGLFETVKTPMRDADGQVIGVLGIARDITAQRRSAEALGEREELYRTIVSEAGDGIVLFDPKDGALVEFNDRACAYLGRTREVLGSLSVFQLFDHVAPDRLRGTLDGLNASSGPHGFELNMRLPDGAERQAWITAQKVMLRGRALVLAVWHDLTERREAEAVIDQERRVRDTLIESIPGLFFALDDAGRMALWNRQFEAVTERGPAEIDGLPAADLFIGPQRDHIIERIGRVFDAGRADAEADIVAKSGRRRPFYFTGVRVDIGGRPMLVGTGTDLSALRQAQDELRRLNAELEQRVQAQTTDLRRTMAELQDTQFAMDSVGIGISWVDFETGRFVHANRQLAASLGYRDDELLGLHVWDIDPNFPPEAFRGLAAEIRARGHQQFETSHRTRGGEQFPVEMTVYFHAGDHAPARLIAFSANIARRKGAERALLQAKEDAEAASRAKSEFLANMSHEIRTPMNAIIGLTHLMRRSDPSPEQLERLAKIDSSGRHLLSIINDILDLAKIEAGRLELDATDFHLSSVLDNVASIIREPARDKGLAIEVDTDSVPMWLSGDPMRLRQALLNFAGNAVKFTERGTIWMNADLLEDQGGELLVRFEVKDTGAGIPADKIERLFHDFEQTDAATARRHGGTGLGLSISRKLAQLMGGEVGVSSQVGVGSSFWFTARLQRGKGVMPVDVLADERDLQPWEKLRHVSARVLLVEDNAINREVALQLLHGSALSVDTAGNGQQAVQMAQAHLYDLVLMDVQMPIKDGLQATREMRGLPGWSAVPIVAMTANAFDEDRKACKAAGMDAFVAKPVDANVLYSVLLKWLPAPAPAIPAAALPERRRALGDAGLLVPPPVGTAPAPAVGPGSALRRLADRPGVDVARGVAALRGKRDRYLDLFCRFVTTQRESMLQLQAAMRKGDPATARFLAHNLKGAAGTLGAMGLSGRAARLEAALRSQVDDGRSAMPSEADLQAIMAELDELAADLDLLPT